jgi:hypothetical protein
MVALGLNDGQLEFMDWNSPKDIPHYKQLEQRGNGTIRWKVVVWRFGR